MPPKLDDAPWKNRTPEEQAREVEYQRRDNLRVKLSNGDALQLAQCPDCLALVQENDLPQHTSLVHAEDGK